MLKPDYFDDKSDIIVEYYQQLEDWILQDIAQRLLASEGVSGTADWRLWKLEQLGMHRNEIARKLSKLTSMSQKEVKELLKDAVSTSWKDDLKTFLRMGKDIPNPLKSKKYMDLINAEYAKTLGRLDNLTNTTISASQGDLLNLLNQAEMFTGSGTMSYSEAVNYVLDEYAKKGVTVVEYDSGLRRSVESAVETVIRTSMNQTAGQLTNQYIVDEGVEYVLVSAHTGARHVKGKETQPESHDYWQGKVFKIRGSEEGYPNLLESTGYDIQPDGRGIVVNKCGLHGINCRHSHQPWDKEFENPWIDKETGKPLVNKADSIEKYENQQKQRAMERSIRSSKRQLLVKQEEIDACKTTEEKEKLQANYDRLAFKLKEKNKAYDDFCKENDLQKQAERVKVMRWNREQARIASGRATKYANSIFKTDSDPIRKYLGRAEDSHPELLNEILADLNNNNVEIVRRKGNMSYQPLIAGIAGQVCVEPDASISAWLHEYKHFCDDRDDGYLGMEVISNTFKCKKREWDAFQVEIEFAEKLGYNDVVKELKRERQKGLQRFNKNARRNR